MTASIAALFRYPIKGFAPEPQKNVDLAVGEGFPFDRMFAIEDGPSGFDAARPAFVSKQKFTVLAKYAEVARARTAYDETTGTVRAAAGGLPDLEADLTTPTGQSAFCAWVADLLKAETDRPLRLVQAAGHRFTDHPLGHISILNLASVRDLESELGLPVDPLRFRANLHVEGWPAWAELDWTDRTLRLGDAEAKVFKPIVRCAATEVDPVTAVRDLDMTTALFDHYGHLNMGIYVQVTKAGHVGQGDGAVLLEG